MAMPMILPEALDLSCGKEQIIGRNNCNDITRLRDVPTNILCTRSWIGNVGNLNKFTRLKQTSENVGKKSEI